MKAYRFIATLSLGVAILSVGNLSAARRNCRSSISPWSVKELFETPNYSISDPENGVVKIIYEAMQYRGNTKEVFAYYSTPGLLSGDRSLDHDLPAVVCVHGGGGRAFEEWVKLWASRGYAAISMDLRGYGAGGANGGEELQYGFKEGEKRKTPTFVSFAEQRDDWFFQAIGDVVTAHSLIRSFAEVDSKRTAIVGISWGGIITTLVAGLDNRFSAAVPVYGCGYLFESGAMMPQIIDGGEVTQDRWHRLYDPSLYVGGARMPMMFVNGTNDHHFHTDQWQKSSNQPKKASRSMRLKMVHNHVDGWKPEEIFEFIGSHLKKNEYTKTPKFSKLNYKNRELSCKIKHLEEGCRAFIVYTKHPIVAEEAEWVKSEVRIVDDRVVSPIEDKCEQCFFCVELPSGANYSSSILFM